MLGSDNLDLGLVLVSRRTGLDGIIVVLLTSRTTMVGYKKPASITSVRQTVIISV